MSSAERILSIITRKSIESWVIYLKADLQIAQNCKTARETLLKILCDTKLFSPEIVTAFKDHPPNRKYPITDTDPEIIVLYKNIVNALLAMEQALKRLEEININPDQYYLTMGTKALGVVQNSVNEIYEAIQLINQSKAGVQSIVSPIFTLLTPKIIQLQNKMHSLSSGVSENRAMDLAAAINILPNEEHKDKDTSLEIISTFTYTLPQYLDLLQELVAPKATKLSSVHKEKLQAQAQIMKEKLKNLSDAQLGSAAYHSANVLTRLLALSTEVLNKSGPALVTAYDKAVLELNNIRQEVIPALVIELERAEQNAGLHEGVLINTLIPKINYLYATVANSIVSYVADPANMVQQAQAALNSIPLKAMRKLVGDKNKITYSNSTINSENLPILFNAEALYKIEYERRTRLNAAKILQNNQKIVDTAEQFFLSLDALTKEQYFTDLLYVEADKKILLWHDYLLIRPHIQATNPDIDRFLIYALDPKNTKTSTLTTITSALSNPTEAINNVTNTLDAIGTAFMDIYYQHLWGIEPETTVSIPIINQMKDDFASLISLGKNTIAAVVACKTSVITHIYQEHAQGVFDQAHINRASNYAYEHYHTSKPSSEPTILLLAHQVQALKLQITDSENSGVAITSKIIDLTEAEKGLNEFYHLLRDIDDIQANISGLAGEQKEPLRKAYQKFQAYFLSSACDYGTLAKRQELNDRIVNSLNELTLMQQAQNTALLKKPKLNKQVLMAMKSDLKENLQEIKTNLIQVRNEIIDADLKAKPKTPIATDNNKDNSLFESIRSLELSIKLDKFIQNTLFTHLQTKLSPTVFKELFGAATSLNDIKLPYTDMYLDGPEVQRYKQLINALYQLHQGLKKIEHFEDYSNEEMLSRKGLFIWTLLDTIGNNLGHTYFHLHQLSADPELNKILNQGLEILKPITDNQLIKSYLPLSFESFATSKTKTINAVDEWKKQQEIVQTVLQGKELPKKSNAPETIKKQQLHSGKDYSETEEAKANKTLRDTLSGFINYLVPQEFIPSFLKKDKPTTPTQIDTIANYIYSIIPNELKSMTEEEHTITEEDEELVVVTTPEEDVNQKMRLFVHAVSKVTQANPYAHQRFVNTMIVFEQQLSKITKLGKEATLKKLGSLEKLATDVLEICDELEVQFGYKAGSLSEPIYQRFHQFYDALLLNLNIDESIKTKLFTQGSKTTINRLNQARIDLLTSSPEHSEAKKIVTAFNEFEKLLDDYFVIDFANRENEFLEKYQKLQPYLFQINPSFDMHYFFRPLKTPNDFLAAYDEIILLQAPIFKLAERSEKSNSITKELHAERIRYLEKLMELEASQAKQREKYLRLKQFVGQQLKNTPELVNAIGTEYMDIFINQVLNEMKDLPNNTLTASKIAETLNSKKALIAGYSFLKVIVQETNKRIKQEEMLYEKDAINLGRIEKIEALNEYRIKLLRIRLPINATGDTVSNLLSKNSNFKSIDTLNKEYDALIKAHAILEKMHHRLANLYNPTKHDLDKITYINTLKTMLGSNIQDLPTRFKSVLEFTQKEENSSIINDTNPEELSLYTSFRRTISAFFNIKIQWMFWKEVDNDHELELTTGLEEIKKTLTSFNPGDEGGSGPPIL
ncbi:MAG: hypothetical protein WC627_03335 [Legionella sp.]|jgi:hypothetical protein